MKFSIQSGQNVNQINTSSKRHGYHTAVSLSLNRLKSCINYIN